MNSIYDCEVCNDKDGEKMTTTAESRCVVCGGKVEEYHKLVLGCFSVDGYHCVRCKLRYSEPPPKVWSEMGEVE